MSICTNCMYGEGAYVHWNAYTLNVHDIGTFSAELGGLLFEAATAIMYLRYVVPLTRIALTHAHPLNVQHFTLYRLW